MKHAGSSAITVSAQHVQRLIYSMLQLYKKSPFEISVTPPYLTEVVKYLSTKKISMHTVLNILVFNTIIILSERRLPWISS